MAENDLIRRGDALKDCKWAERAFPDGDYVARHINDMISTYPAVDAVEVVRCKDCKWYEQNGEFFSCANPSGGSRCSIPSDWYCADGERKTDDGKS